MKSALIQEAMGKIEAHSLKIEMMASYLHYLATNRCTNILNQIKQKRMKIWVIFKFLLQILACIIKKHYIIDSLCTKKYFEEKNGWKSCLQGELNPGLLRDRPSSWPLDQVVTNEIEKKILWCPWCRLIYFRREI